LGLDLSIGTINRCVHEAGRALVPVEDQLVKELVDSGQVHADETHWKESGLSLWLWVLSSAEVSLFLIGYRSAEIFENALGNRYQGWVMSDGYAVYRSYQHRLRCCAQLVRKARGLVESLDGAAIPSVAAHEQRGGTRTQALDHRPQDQLRHAHRARQPGLRLAGQCDRDLPQTKDLALAIFRQSHRRTAQG
jgi:hypothetical protein